LLHPPSNGDLVALDRATLGLLAAPSQRRQYLPDMCGVIPDTELLANHFGHAWQRPEIRPVPGPLRPSRQRLH
jgi:hypothetical protein